MKSTSTHCPFFLMISASIYGLKYFVFFVAPKSVRDKG